MVHQPRDAPPPPEPPPPNPPNPPNPPPPPQPPPPQRPPRPPPPIINSIQGKRIRIIRRKIPRMTSASGFTLSFAGGASTPFRVTPRSAAMIAASARVVSTKPP